MKTHTIYLLIIAGLLLILILGGLYLWEQDKQVQGLESANAAIQAEVVIRKNKEGHLLTEKLTAELRVKDLEKSMPKLAQAIVKDFDIKLRNLRGYMQSEFAARGSGNLTISRIPFDTTELTFMATEFTISMQPYRHGGYYYTVNSDTIRMTSDGRPMEFQPFLMVADDGYLNLQAEVYSEFNSPYQYTYSDTIKQAYVLRREKWYKPRKLYGSAKMSNPNAQVLNTQSVLIREYKNKRFGIGPYVGYSVDGPSFGIAIQWSIIKF